MDSSTKKSGKSRTSRTGSRGRRSTPVKTSNPGNFLLRNPTLWALPTGEEQLKVSINGYWTGTTKSLHELLPSTASLSLKPLETGIYRLVSPVCVDFQIPADNTIKSLPFQVNQPSLTSSLETLFSRLESLSQELSGKDRESFLRCMTQLCVIFTERQRILKQLQTPVSSSLQPLAPQSPK